MVLFNLNCVNDPPEIIIRRCWKKYSKELLCNELRKSNFNLESDDPQSIWNDFEQKLLTVVDKILPYSPFINNSSASSLDPPRHLKSKINLRKKLLKSSRLNPSNLIRIRLNNINREIKYHFKQLKYESIQRSIIPGNSKSLWRAVKIAKNMNISEIPKIMYKNDQIVNKDNIPSAFADFFITKVKTIVNDTQIDPNVYNGKRKLIAQSEHFMQTNHIMAAIKTLKIKKL